MPGDMMNTPWSELAAAGSATLTFVGALWWLWLRATGRIRTDDDD